VPFVLRTSRRRLLGGLALAAIVPPIAACTPSGGTTSPAVTTATASDDLWDTSVVHTITISYQQADYDALIQAYLKDQDKTWISATAVIDGTTYDNVGFKLKGNSSLRGLSTDANASLSSTKPQSLPWRIKLDKYVDDQSHQGSSDLVVRGNNSATSLNEAVALGLLGDTGLATQKATEVRFTIGTGTALRLVIENPNDAWMQRELGDGLLYKADADGDYSYRGDAAKDYKDIFDQDGGKDDLTPLIAFLKWINQSSDADFASKLSAHLDVDKFATYLAFQDLVQNSDDIDGPGNNSYLYWDPTSKIMTVVNWDLNLAFGGGMGGMGGGRGGANPGGGPGGLPSGAPSGGMPGGMPSGGAPGGQAGGQGGGQRGGGFAGKSNILVERFNADASYASLITKAKASLTDSLFASGTATKLLNAWTTTVKAGASDLVSDDTITSESSALAAKFPS